ncbi:MAG: bifunctional glutamate N-acetyltransferase/amino-acid acetyltransferase ArgJ [Candidatus Omnitrophota bacterium]
MKELKNCSICAPLGFKTNALCCGIKKTKLDLGLIFSIVSAKAAGVFTTNKIKAAPVSIDEQQLKNFKAQAIIINSGNANCCTGKKGYQDALKTIEATARHLKINKDDCLVASTGVIGKFLPVAKILKALPDLIQGLGFNRADAVAASIMTTDKFAKKTAVQIKIKNKPVTIGAIAKGAGMISPDMATMLCFITTDANISGKLLKRSLKIAVDNSFNCISVDGQMSTNDSVIIMANGLAQKETIKDKTKEFKIFTKAVEYVCLKLAKMIVIDGEGATKLIKVCVNNAQTQKQAKIAAEFIANSPLVKTMIAGHNPNWGRIPACLGASKINFKESKLELFLQNKKVYSQGKPGKVNRNNLIDELKKKEILIKVNLNNGKFSHTLWTSDLTAEYVKINTAYN